MLKSRGVVVVLITILFISCKSTQLVNIGSVSNITDAKLRKNLQDNELAYNKIYLKKVQFSYTNDQDKKSFKGSFVIQKDSFIIVSVYALMGIELIRAKLTPEEVVIVDKHNKKVIHTDYSFFGKKYGLEFNYNSIQSLLTNSLFLYPSEDDFYDGLKKYKHQVQDDFYSFKSIKDKRLDRLNKKSRNNLLIHDIDIYPDIYRIFKVYIRDFSTDQTLNLDYKDFKLFDKVLFPEVVSFKGKQGNSSVDIEMKFSYIEIDNGGSTHFKIPSTYAIKTM